METVSKPPADPGKAGRRIRAYLRCIGINDDTAIERLSEQILSAPDGAGSSDGLEKAAMENILRQTEVWLLALNEYAAKNGLPRPDPLAGRRLRMIVSKDPAAFLCQPDIKVFSDTQVLGYTLAVPEIKKSIMPTQQLGRLPLWLRKEFRQKIVSNLKNVWHKLTGFFHQE